MSFRHELDALCQRQITALDGVAEALAGAAAEEETASAWRRARADLDRALAAYGRRPVCSAAPGPELNRVSRAAPAPDRVEREGRQTRGWRPPKAAGAEGELLKAGRLYAQGKVEPPFPAYSSKARGGRMGEKR